MINFDLESIGLKSLNKEEPCKGLIFKGYTSLYTSDNKVERREGVRLLKRKSCSGCKECTWMLEDLDEHVYHRSLILPEIENGTYYRLITTDISTDMETGIINNYNLKFIKEKENGNV